MNDDSNGNPPEADGWVDPYSPTEAHSAVGPDRPGPSQPHEPPRHRPQGPQDWAQPQPPSGPEQQRPEPQEQYPQRYQGGPPAAKPKDPYNVEDGKMMAMLSHSSVLLGIPLFIIPMLQKDNEFALHHGKAAGANFIFFCVAIAVTVFTCGLAFPLIFVVYIPMLVGFVKAINGERAGGWAFGGMGESLFRGVQIDETRQIEHLD